MSEIFFTDPAPKWAAANIPDSVINTLDYFTVISLDDIFKYGFVLR
jgi:hypothetical protein